MKKSLLLCAVLLFNSGAGFSVSKDPSNHIKGPENIVINGLRN